MKDQKDTKYSGNGNPRHERTFRNVEVKEEQIGITEEETLLFLYHVTPSINVPKIKAEGLKYKKKATFSGEFGMDVRKVKGVYAFTDLNDALRFAGRFGWDGKIKFSIIKFKRGFNWIKDPHFEASTGLGDWLVNEDNVGAEYIKAIMSFDPTKIRVIPGEFFKVDYVGDMPEGF